MAEEVKEGSSGWDSSPEWDAARERTRAEVQAAFAPRPQTCPACGKVEATAARSCPHCGASYVVVQPKMSKRARLWIAAGMVLVLAAGGIAWLLASPSINHLKKTAAQREAEQQAAFIKRETARLKAEQRLHRGRGTSLTERPAALVSDLRVAITNDARSRVAAHTLSGNILGTDCAAVTHGPYVPNSVHGGYECLAVSSHIVKGNEVGGKIGYPFWAIVDFRHRTFAWCKVNPKGGERAVQSLEPVVNPPAGCDLKT
jgi:hypothetical protein